MLNTALSKEKHCVQLSDNSTLSLDENSVNESNYVIAIATISVWLKNLAPVFNH